MSDCEKLWLFVISDKDSDKQESFHQFKTSYSYNSVKTSMIMSGHEACKIEDKIKKKIIELGHVFFHQMQYKSELKTYR